MQNLKLAEDIFDELENGKRTTIRQGRRDIKLGDLVFESVEEKRREYVSVTMVYYCLLGDVIVGDILNDGFMNSSDMIKQMKQFYPKIAFDTEVTVIRFFKTQNHDE